MKKETFNFLSTNKKTQIHAIKWTPQDEVIAIVQIAHGMVEYIDRYDDFAKFLNKNGILVVGHDHLGHGDSVTNQDEWGFFDSGDATQYLIDDMYQITQMIQKEYPGIPYYVFGHSMGSFITRNYLTQYSHSVDGAIICGTGQNPKMQLVFGRMFTKVMAAFKGWNYRSPMIDKMAFGGMNKGIDNPRTEKDWLTRDSHHVDLYLAEPRCQFMFTLNGYYHLFNTCILVQTPSIIEGVRKDLPILLIAGDKDPVGEFGKTVQKTYEQYKKLGIKDLECKLYPEYRHEILNEIDNKTVYEDVLSWILKHQKSR